MSRKIYWGWLAIVSALPVLASFFLEWHDALSPCSLCQIQRLGFLLLVVLSVLMYYWKQPTRSWTLGALMLVGLIIVVGAAVAAYQWWWVTHPTYVGQCFGTLFWGNGPYVTHAHRCDVAPYYGGLPLPAWSLISYGGLGILYTFQVSKLHY